MGERQPRMRRGSVYGTWPGVFGILLGVLTGIVTAAPSPAPDGSAGRTSPRIEKFLADWAGSFREVKTLRVRFVQTKELKILRRPRVSHGVALVKGQRLLMRIRDAADELEMELLVADGEARIHYPRHRRVEIYPASAGDASTRKAPFPLLREDVETLPDDYRLELIDGEEGEQTLVMRPRDEEESQFEVVRLRFRKGRIVGIEQENRRGDRVRMEIEEFEINPDLGGESLELVLAEGTEVVHALEEDRR